MSSLLSDEPLSLTLLKHELERLTPQHSALQSGAEEDRAAAHLCNKIVSSSSKLASSSDAIASKEAAEAFMTTSSDILTSMHRLILLTSKVHENGKEDTDGGKGPAGDAAASLHPQLSRCTGAWAKWMVYVPCLPHFYASCIAVRLPALLASVSARGSSHVWGSFFGETAECTLQLLLRASRTLPPEVLGRYLPPRSLQPPWKVLVTCAQFSWASNRLCGVLESEGYTTPSSSNGAAVHDQLQRASVNPVFFEVQERVELAHADQFARDVLLFSYDSVNWKAGNAVPTVKSVAPSMWCLFLRCRSLALHGLTEQRQDAPSLSFFQDGVARRLTARVLQRSIDGIRSCLARNATDMHADRVEQLTTRDVPCVVLITRLWYLYLQPYPTLLKTLHASLVRLVNTAVELRNPLTIEEISIGVGAHVDEELDEHARHVEAEEHEQAKREAARANCFLDVVWDVEPLQEYEVLLDVAGVPWSPSFSRAAAIQAVLDERVVVTTVE
ncbi:hypothetical protein ABB37_03491 [Leptomonas pyrrhocoris]|uniref:Uncharacterized protein n=1 Tax=Leptomonas pyrrhocoris TaxID=157538 RepID=A0A0M9G598_LEPPY|nr:hypothetical protein ABB37_03491 [Leptomonas pyrrhocoris]KPA82419.1 hypothetical protein ABB37_03491 [Leptomonas pyrrhocoris]|eukprot:XP_015660858.1 hypothetical protein ABB37_03491 [Leptomonas pyrrhocoris]